MKKSRLMVVIRHTICTGIASNLHFRERSPPLNSPKASSSKQGCSINNATSLPPTLLAVTLPHMGALQKSASETLTASHVKASSSMIYGEAKVWHVPFNDAEEAKVSRREAEERENNQGQ